MRTHRFSILLLAIIALIIGPLFSNTSAGQSLVFGIAFLSVLVFGAVSVRGGRAPRFAVATLAVAAGVVQIASLSGIVGVPPELRLGLFVAFLSLAIALVLRDVMKTEPVTWDKISGAVCAYLLVGVTWGLLYAWIRIADPSAFSGPAAAVGDTPGEPMIYYSFVTLTTLGFGDVTPVSHTARTLTWLEAIVGQIYLVVLVARLVGLHTMGGSHLESD